MKHKICSIFGARPQFIKAYSLSKALDEIQSIQEIRIHTGQHYDPKMSGVFFTELGIPEPDHNLEVGSGPHGQQTGLMLEKIEKLLIETQPRIVIVYGDTNSTLAGALAAAKLKIPVAHIEAGMRTGDRLMPEEINRMLTDRISNLLFCPTQTAVDNLAKEGISHGVHLTGDVMVDTFKHFRGAALEKSNILQQKNLAPRQYILMTSHRAENTDNPQNLKAILNACSSSNLPVIFPIHPRTRKVMAENSAPAPANIHLCDPVSYLDMIALICNASMILTDSGGIQKEAYIASVPCVTMRDHTEWAETIQSGWNTLTGADESLIRDRILNFRPSGPQPDIFGPPGSAQKTAAAIHSFL